MSEKFSVQLQANIKPVVDKKSLDNVSKQIQNEIDKQNPTIEANVSLKKASNEFGQFKKQVDDLANAQISQLKEMKTAGKEGTDEYKQLEAQLQSTLEMIQNINKIKMSLNVDTGAFSKLEDTLKNLDLGIDTKQFEQQLKSVIQNLKDIGNIDIESLKQFAAYLPENEIKNLNTDLQNLSNSLDGVKIGNDAKTAAEEYDKAFKNISKLLDTQRKALNEMQASGKTGTQAYIDLSNAIKQTENQLTELQEANKNINLEKPAKDFSSALSEFGFVAQGLNTFTSSIKSITDPFVNLDTATAQIKTLGGAAKENAENFERMALAMSKKIPINAADIQAASYNALSAGIEATTEKMEAFMEASAKLAVGGSESINNTVDVLSSLLNAYGETAEKATEYSDILFQTVNLGKTTIPELSRSLSQVIPTAAAYGASLKDIGASLAIMTAKGVPTAQATTRLNQMLIQMQKPSAELKNALEGAGVTIEELGDRIRGGDFIGALQLLQDAFEKAGVSATQAFGSAEASSAFNTLTGDINGLAETLNQFNNAAGTTEDAFNDMSDTIENRANQLKTTLESVLTSVINVTGPIGETGVASIQILSEMLPYINTLNGINTLFGNTKQQLTGIAAAVTGKLIPSLMKYNTAAQSATAVQKALNIAMNVVKANPMIAVFSAIAMASAGIAAVVSQLKKSAEEQKKINLELKKNNEELIEGNKQRQNTINNIDALIKKYDELGKKTSLTKNEEKELADVQAQLNKEIPEAQIGILSYSESLDILKKKSAENVEGLSKLKTEAKELQQTKIDLDIELATNDVDIEIDKLKNKLSEATEGGWIVQTKNDVLNFIAGWQTFGLLDDVFTPNPKKIAMNISNSIKEATSEAELAKAKEQMQELFESEWWQKEATAEEKNSLMKSFDALTEAKVKEIQAVEKAKVEVLSNAVKEAYDKNIKETAGGMITDEAARKIAEQTETTVEQVKEMYNEIKNEAVKANIGEQIENIVKSTEKLKDVQALKQLEDDFKNAKDAAEKARIAEKIQEWAPAAVKVVDTIVDENGKLVNSYEVSSEAVEEMSKALEESVSKELIDNQNNLLKTFEKQGETFAYNEKKLKDLQKQITTKSMRGEDVSQLRAEYDKLAASMSNQKDVMLSQLEQMEKEGTATDKIYNSIAKSIKQQPDELKKVIQAEVQRKQLLEQQLQLQEEVNKAVSYNKAKDTEEVTKAQQRLWDMTARYNQWVQNNSVKAAKSDPHAKKLLEDVTAAKEALKQAKQNADWIEKTNQDVDAFNKTFDKSVKTTTASAKAKETEFEKNEKILNSLKNKYELEQEIFKINTDNLILSEKRVRTDYDDYKYNQEQLKILEKEKNDLIEYLKLKDDFMTTDNLSDLSIGIKLEKDELEKAQKLVVDFIKEYNNTLKDIQTYEAKVDLTQLDLLEERLKDEMKTINLKFGIDDDSIRIATENVNKITDDMLSILTKRTEEIKAKLEEAMKAGTNQEYILNLTKELNEAKSKVNDIINNRLKATKDANEKEIELLKQKYETENELNKNSLDKQKEQATNFVNFLNQSLIATIHTKLEIDTENINDELQNELDKLDQQFGKKEKLTYKEELYNKKRLEIEKKYQEEKEKLQIQAAYREQSLNLQNQRRMAELEEQQRTEQLKKEEEYYKKSLELQLNLINTLQEQRNKTQDDTIKAMYDAQIASVTENAEQMKLKIQEIEGTMSTVSQNLALSGEEIAKTFVSIFDSMIASGEQITSIKDGLRLILKTFSEFLIREAEAALETYLFSSSFWSDIALKSGGIIAFVPALLAIAKSSLKAIISPLITSITSKLLSFSTGGRIDSPTLALIGDGNRLGGDNKEWVFRDDQLRSLVEEVVDTQNNKISNSFKALQNSISNINLTSTIKGSDIILSVKRTEFENSLRNY